MKMSSRFVVVAVSVVAALGAGWGPARAADAPAPVLATAPVHRSQSALNRADLPVKAGDTLDFVVDIGGTLNSDEFTWEIVITEKQASGAGTNWNAKSDFHGPATAELEPWAQLAQVLFSANEFVFVD